MLTHPRLMFAAGCGAAILTAATAVVAQQDGQAERDAAVYRLEVETVANGLEHPWGLALLPDGRFLVTERNPGHLRIGTPDGALSPPVENVPEIFRYEGPTPRSQAGMFDVKLHPDFMDNQQIYLSYSAPTDRGAALTVSRARLIEEAGTAPRLENVQTIFQMKEDDQDASGLHFGGRMAIDYQDRTIFLSAGERRNISRSQDPNDQAGSILRFDLDGNPHQDNPFKDGDSGDEFIYAIGLRNPQGLGFDPVTGDLWANDHGPLGGDALHRIEAGENYGWPYITGGRDYSGAPIGVGMRHEGMRSPVHVFEDTVAPSGLVFYQGDMFAEWEGSMLNGGMASESIERLRIDNGSVVAHESIEIGRRVRDVQVDTDGSIWLVTEHEDGEVMRLRRADDTMEY